METEYFYYELPKVIADSKYDGVIYWTSHSKNPSLGIGLHLAKKLEFNSNRIWRETSSGVKYVKNREHGILKTVDMREFFLVKLRSKPHILKELQ